MVAQYNGGLREKALTNFNLSPPQLAFVLNPVKLDEHSTANQRERIGGFLPYILPIVGPMAGMYPAIDLGAGEKGGGTLETLLLAPIPRTELVIGKFMVLFSRTQGAHINLAVRRKNASLVFQGGVFYSGGQVSRAS